MSRETRLRELRAKDTLTDKEMDDLIRLSPSGTFRKGPNLTTMGVVDIARAFKNLEEGPIRAGHALSQGCYLEVISLRLQHAELWLRMFWVANNSERKIFEPNDRRTFGRLVRDCRNVGFSIDLD